MYKFKNIREEFGEHIYLNISLKTCAFNYTYVNEWRHSAGHNLLKWTLHRQNTFRTHFQFVSDTLGYFWFLFFGVQSSSSPKSDKMKDSFCDCDRKVERLSWATSFFKFFYFLQPFLSLLFPFPLSVCVPTLLLLWVCVCVCVQCGLSVHSHNILFLISLLP